MAIKYSKISVNIPVELLEEFDKVCEVHSYSRAEAVKEAFRQFIVDQMPEGYFSPQMKQLLNQSIREQSVEWMKGIAQASVDPEVQQLQYKAAQDGIFAGMRAGIEQRLQEQGIKLSEEQQLQLAERLQIAREKTTEIQKEKNEAKQKLRKQI